MPQVIETQDPRCLVPAFEGLAPAEAAAGLLVAHPHVLRLLHCAVSHPAGESGGRFACTGKVAHDTEQQAQQRRVQQQLAPAAG